MNSNQSRPFGVLVDTRLPVEHPNVLDAGYWELTACEGFTASFVFPAQIDTEAFNAAFRNAEAAEASE